jgi:hypothetical protein
MNESLQEKIERLATERARVAREEEQVRYEAQQELDRIVREIEALEKKRETLEAYLNIDDDEKRLQHGTIRNLVFDILSRHPGGLTSSQIKEVIEKENPGMRTASVPASLSYQAAQGRVKRDNYGRYTLAD